MKKSFVTVTPDSGSNNGTLNVTADSNQDQDRSETIVVAGSGVTKTFEVIQERLRIPIPIIRVGFDFTQSYYNTVINESNGLIEWRTNCLLSAVTTNETGEISVGNLKSFSDYININNNLIIRGISIYLDKTGNDNTHVWTFKKDQSSYDIKNDTLVLTQDVYYNIVNYIRTMLQTASGAFVIRVMNAQKILDLEILIDY